MLGQQILNYRITAKIGEGGMGSVFKAQHTQLDRPAAIKALHPNLVSNAMIRERFKNEAATMAHLRHPSIVSLYDYLETPQGLFLIMEFVEGYPLDRYIQEVSGPIPEARALALFTKILEGFAYAHQQGVVHRDIKPSNLIISADGQDVKILDFGIAKLLDGSTKNLTKTGSRMGTVLYMSPEQVKGGMLDQRSDIYSLGVTLFQMLTGRCPYDEATATEYEVYHQIVNFPLPRLQEFYPGASSRMQALIDRATAKNPEDRFASCDEFKAALLGQNALPKQGPALQKTPPLPSPAFSQAERESTSGPRRRQSGWLWAVAVFLCLALAGVVVVLNPFEVAAFRPWQWENWGQEAPSQDELSEIRTYIAQFYAAVESHDFDNIRPFYRETVENYFGNENRRLVPDIRAAYLIYWKKYVGERHEIDWESLDVSQEEESQTTQVRFSMRYYFKTEEADWKNLLINTEIRFDAEQKIFYIDKF